MYCRYAAMDIIWSIFHVPQGLLQRAGSISWGDKLFVFRTPRFKTLQMLYQNLFWWYVPRIPILKWTCQLHEVCPTFVSLIIYLGGHCTANDPNIHFEASINWENCAGLICHPFGTGVATITKHNRSRWHVDNDKPLHRIVCILQHPY